MVGRKKFKLFLIVLLCNISILGIYISFKKGVTNDDKLITEYINAINNPNSIAKIDYQGILEIPKIKLTKGFYGINDSRNNVNKNIQVLQNSQFPSEGDGMLALAAHAGRAMNAYFNQIDKLKLEDEIMIYLKNIIYIYQIRDIYEEDKNGFINIKSIPNTLILTTCSKKNDDKQLTIIATLITTKKAST